MAFIRRTCDLLNWEHKQGISDRRNMTVVLLEEVLEALTEAFNGDPVRLREELIQVSGVAVKWVEIIDHEAAKASRIHCTPGHCTGCCGCSSMCTDTPCGEVTS
jgi:adenine C2-methylase RlmN of 23S rRNA A2503 and tRNA A37